MLLYTLALGPSEKSIAQQSYRSGDPLPERIANAPELYRGLELYYDAFFDLDTTRNHSLGLTRISILNVKEYAQAWEYDQDQTERLLYFIPRMDTECLLYLKSKRPIASGNAETIRNDDAPAGRPNRPPRIRRKAGGGSKRR